ncbi:DoxX family protein [bacterium]|nr:DoxX family protein [bacterium]
MNVKLAWGLRLVPAVLIGQTLAFKFSGAAESVALFTDLATKAFGKPCFEGTLRIGTGIIELVTVVLLLIPKHSWKGAFLVVGTMAGALASHLGFIGLTGHGPLPAMAVISLLASVIYLLKSKAEILKFLGGLKKSSNSLKKKSGTTTIDNAVVKGEA